MTSKELSNGILRSVGILLLIAIALYLMYALSSVIIYLVLAMVYSLMVFPIVRFLKTRLKFNNTVAVITTLFISIVFFAGFILLFVPLIINQAESVSQLNFNSLQTDYKELFAQINARLSNYNLNLDSLLKSSKLSSKINFSFIPTLLNGILNTLGNFGMAVASILFISFFMLKDKIQLYAAFVYILPSNHKRKVITSMQSSQNLLTRYFIGLLIQLIIIYVLYLIVFLIFGVKNAVIISLLCAIFNIIPYLGPLLGMIVAVVLIFISGIETHFDATFNTVFYVLIGMFVVQLIDNNISSPIIFSKSTKSHPLEIFLVIIAAGILFGITGMIIAIPMYTVLKVISKAFFAENKLVKILTKNL